MEWIGEHDAVKCCFIYVDEDEIPELVVDSGNESEGCRILTCHDGMVDTMATERLYFTYVEKGNRLNNSDGEKGSFFDEVYAIEEGRWRKIAEGRYTIPSVESMDDPSYTFNGVTVTEEEYTQQLATFFDAMHAQEPGLYYTLAGMKSTLKK